MKPLILIPARGGSKGVPGKNIRLLGGKPLIHYAIESARKLFSDECICVSTDDENIKSCVEAIGLSVPFLRPASLSTDSSGTYEVCLHAINYYETNGYFPDTLIILQPTSPFRTPTHISEAINMYDKTIDLVVSVKETKSNPYFVLFEEDASGFLQKSKVGNFQRRQDCPKVWEYNGAVYVININSLKMSPIPMFKKIIKYQMDEISSHDIDTILDWEFAVFISEKMKK